MAANVATIQTEAAIPMPTMVAPDKNRGVFFGREPILPEDAT